MTTKIQFKLSNDVLLTVIQMVEKTDDYVVQSIKDALLVSIKEDLLAKLEDKAKNIQKQVSILDHNKKHAIVLKYHEAYTMYKLLELVYEKETFADHPHIKKIKRLLVDLENKVESFTTENNSSNETQTAVPVLASFPRLGVNEIIIEEATILEGDCSEEMEIQEDNNNPIVDSSIDINEIIVQNYSIFDLLEENHPTATSIEEESKEIEVDAELIPSFVQAPQQNEGESAPAEEEQPRDLVELTQEDEEEHIEASALLTEEGATPVEENNIEPILEQQADELIMQEETTAEETIVPSWAQQTTPPVFDGIVTKTSICIESEDPFTTACSSKEMEEETLNLFEEEAILPVLPQEEKIEKESKKEKKKPAKDNSQQGQISLF